jgi:hypothetical protein
MSADDPRKPPAPITPADSARGSGEGAATALKELIKKRNMGEAPETPAPSASSRPLPPSEPDTAAKCPS